MGLADELRELSERPHDVAGGQELIARAASTVRAAEKLEEAVAAYLDAERAWQFDECAEETMQAAYGAMKRRMYEFREKRQ